MSNANQLPTQNNDFTEDTTYCPECISTNLLVLGEHYQVCMECDWSSLPVLGNSGVRSLAKGCTDVTLEHLPNTSWEYMDSNTGEWTSLSWTPRFSIDATWIGDDDSTSFTPELHNRLITDR